MKLRATAIACMLTALAPCGPAGCVYHSRRPLSRSHDRGGPIQLDSPREQNTARETPAEVGPPSVSQS